MAEIHTTDREKMKLLSNAQLVRPLSRGVLAANISIIASLPSEVALSTVLLNLIACSEPGIDFDNAIGCLPKNASTDIGQILATNLVKVAKEQESSSNPFVHTIQHTPPASSELDIEVEVRQVFSTWAQLSEKPFRAITGEERSLICERLLDGYGPEQLISAMQIAKSIETNQALLLVDVIGKRRRVRANLESNHGH
jgi:hypothetical protein